MKRVGKSSKQSRERQLQIKTESKSEPWLSVDGIASHLGVSKETIYRRLEERAIPAHRIGKLWRFKASEVDAWMKSGRAGEGAENFGEEQLSV